MATQSTSTSRIPSISSRWIREFEREILRRKHVLIHGNVNDFFLRNGRYQTVQQFLLGYFREKGFEIIVRYDPVDALLFATDEQAPPSSFEELPEDMRQRYRELVRRGVQDRNPGLSGTGHRDVLPTFTPPDDPLQTPPTLLPGTSIPREAERISAEDAFGDLRLVLAQGASPAAVIVDLADMLTSVPGQYSETERRALVLLKKCTLEASVISEGRLAGYRNTLVVLAGDLRRVPDWFYLTNPHTSLVHAALPDKDERRQFALQFVEPTASHGGFYGGDKISTSHSEPERPSGLEQVADEFADLTDGLHAIDLEALRITSWTAKIPVALKQIHRLVDFFKFGYKDDPWEQLNPERVRRARSELSRRVIGQPKAVDAVVRMLTSARVGLNLAGTGHAGAPKGVFFFVGPTGVGKTELAKAVTALVFGDERAFKRFDMSEFAQEHAAEKLAGAPPGFVGYDEGGQLTRHVLAHPHSILLFDEVEKAHSRVLDKFLQILEDGRLTDGRGQTAYFNQTAIIFTSNIGASDLTDPRTGQVVRQGYMRRILEAGTENFSYEQVAAHFQDEVRWYFTSRIERPELLNRLGDSVVVFDLLRPEFIRQISEKFFSTLAATALEKHGITLQYLPSCHEFISSRMSQSQNMLLGGRRIKTLIETHIVGQLNEWIFSSGESRGVTLEIGISPEGSIDVHVR